ncbi:hypothetical protein BC835DRAFT_1407056 [Cytidiella melzeri]|nr:hypothetical protein BC835DRAFT_1407056 [Cytidiella melzeri]
MAQPWVPTVDDLRVKLCYICREEEQHGQHPQPPAVWVHPCNCTLVAHEKCLLNWIQSSQEEPARKDKALKCPQCSATYELESNNPRILKLLNNLNGTVTLAGKVVFACSIAGAVAACGFGLYIVMTSYGAHAVQDFLGREMYETLLSDDPSRWPWHAYANLPLVPVSLILSRTKYVNTMPLISLFYCWTTTNPPALPGGPIWRRPLDQYPFQPVLTWPPSPAMVTVMLPVISRVYRRAIQRLEHWAMGIPSAPERRIGRIELALADGGPLNVRIAANFMDDGDAGEGEHAAGAAARDQGQQQEAGAPVQDPAAAAAETVRISGSSLGRFIGGALLIPKIANVMGTLLYHLSMHSLLLRKFLAIRRPLNTRRAPSFWTLLDFYPPRSGTGTWSQAGYGARVGLNVLLAGTKTWAEADPVWWRNSVGLGVFMLARDCLRILHLSLAKKEIETRRVKSRSFAGIDLKELDVIIPTPPPTQ